MIEGDRLEIGCGYGHTTVFLNKFLESSNALKPYYCIDTFCGFTIKDMQYEESYRDNSPNRYKEKFIINKKKWVDFTIRSNGLTNVKTFEADINSFNFEQNNIKKLSFCLLDVDLYLPMKAALEKVYPLMETGGIIIVDDCMPHEYFDGALQAYNEFIEKHNLPKKIVHERIGVIEKL
ncbi:MAG: hypothetical protein A2X61_02960 [Ignavibacteria bacterium GWB2_35_12]|nr:MAG: hypothetical protein A2X63_11595 [Ignavibacteria bacterium GWA2_35_8]OGU38252.1 MAG: hypothetical protein A2X61_02960 [Ignavibacteria bacterium GWB2_35_12]OGU95473.1 MAG: hypothetical protein A2220_07135 [Ignavibacteria bacterium RIFOXYA2_FULL_35_10]OGV20811.1 MAG: hypothetical protein A2475_11590 [Ignavibacteria bacterium RIFOXYC2_FULL_35_21]